MDIKKCSFAYSMANRGDYREEPLPEVAIVGKSNVGKSSLINSLLNHRKLARTSSQPGKTRLVNFFLVNEAFYLVDLPGYGYAKVSKQEQGKWASMIEGYFEASTTLKHIFLLVDIRHEPTAHDKMMMQWIRDYTLPFSIIATKCDKISRPKLAMHADVIKKALILDKTVPFIFYSVPEKRGRLEILELLDKILPFDALSEE
jgi:GTP-binding protein